MRVVVLGTGRLAGARARALAGDAEVTEVLVAGRDVQRATRLAEEVGGRAAQLDDALERPVDGAVVALATAAHAEALRRCFGARVPVLCEKPLSESLAESVALSDEATRTGVQLQVGFQRRFDPGMLAVREAIHDGSLGHLYHLRLAAHDAEPGAEAYIAASGSMFRDLHVHDFDLVRWLTGTEIVEVDACGNIRGHERYTRHGDVDVTALRLATSDGVPVVVTGSRHDPAGYDVRLEALGSRDAVGAGTATASAPRALDAWAELPAGPRFAGFLDRFAEAFRRETRAFVQVMDGRRPSPTPGAEAVEALRAAVAAERSWRDGVRVRVADVADDEDAPSQPSAPTLIARKGDAR